MAKFYIISKDWQLLNAMIKISVDAGWKTHGIMMSTLVAYGLTFDDEKLEFCSKEQPLLDLEVDEVYALEMNIVEALKRVQGAFKQKNIIIVKTK